MRAPVSMSSNSPKASSAPPFSSGPAAARSSAASQSPVQAIRNLGFVCLYCKRCDLMEVSLHSTPGPGCAVTAGPLAPWLLQHKS